MLTALAVSMKGRCAKMALKLRPETLMNRVQLTARLWGESDRRLWCYHRASDRCLHYLAVGRSIQTFGFNPVTWMLILS